MFNPVKTGKSGWNPGSSNGPTIYGDSEPKFPTNGKILAKKLHTKS